MQSIYLYEPPETEKFTNTWIYYRIASVGAEEPAWHAQRSHSDFGGTPVGAEGGGTAHLSTLQQGTQRMIGFSTRHWYVILYGPHAGYLRRLILPHAENPKARG